jgi:hypothetical protein
MGNLGDLSRRAKIEAMLAAEPRDTFLRYSLAMELQKEGAWDESWRCFQGLMRDEPAHVPSFFMGSKLLVQMRRIEEARATLRDGIEQARGQGDHHAAAEMAEFLMALGD